MTKEKEREERAKKTVQILLQLDEVGLLIIESNSKVLLARQRLDE
ncbi:MAG: hypothetical protein PUB46_00170 [Lachnospiraceae bacterium]|nr:hypothetical protein [Lachnospiraceae bacterium]